MMPYSDTLPVNWIDGMKISKAHFLALQDYMGRSLANAANARLTDVNFGLISDRFRGNPLKLSFLVDNHKLIKVKLEECNAITHGGETISISPVIAHTLNLEAVYDAGADEELKGGSEKTLLIQISVNPFKPIPFGEPDLEEDPPRQPFLLPEYKLSIVPQSNNRAGYATCLLTIGRIIARAAEARLDEAYIPPSATMESHPRLIELYHFINRFYGQLEINTIQIIQKIHAKSQNNPLAMMVLELADKMALYLGQIINRSVQLSLYEPPVCMLHTVAALGRIMKNYIDSRTGSGKEELLNYFAEWCGIQQGALEALFSELVNTVYDHTDIYLLADKVILFATAVGELFAALSRLDYIGRKRETGIFVKEREETGISIIDNKPKNRKSFLED